MKTIITYNGATSGGEHSHDGFTIVIDHHGSTSDDPSQEGKTTITTYKGATSVDHAHDGTVLITEHGPTALKTTDGVSTVIINHGALSGGDHSRDGVQIISDDVSRPTVETNYNGSVVLTFKGMGTVDKDHSKENITKRGATSGEEHIHDAPLDKGGTYKSNPSKDGSIIISVHGATAIDHSKEASSLLIKEHGTTAPM